MSITAASTAQFDPEIYQTICDEYKRQQQSIELIASENFASPQVLDVCGSIMTNKYAEGYPSKRYYGGCEFVDVAEQLAIERVKMLFGADYANVQPHSGSQANGAVYQALLEPGDTLLGMSLSAGGHLTHGSRVNMSGRLYHSVQYGVDSETGLLDYDEVARLARECRPKLIVAGFSAYSRIMDWQKFRQIADEVGAYLMVDMAHIAGLVATGLYPSPVAIADVVTSTTHKTLRGPRGGLILARANADIEKKLQSAVFPGIQGGPFMHIIAAKAVAFKEALTPEFKTYQQQVIANARAMATALMAAGYAVVSGGTDCHLLLLDLRQQKLTGKAAEVALENVGITTNKNTVPSDPQSPFVTSGLRLGTPAVTTRGFKEHECAEVGNWIAQLLDNLEDNQTIATMKQRVTNLCQKFPIYKC